MIKVTKVERNGQAAVIYMDVKDRETPFVFLLRLGLLESYQGVYGMKDPMDAMRMMLIDGVIDAPDSSVTAAEDPEAETKTAAMVKKHQSKINWNGFFDKIKELATMDDEDEAEEMKSAWRQHRKNLLREKDRVLPTKAEKDSRQRDLSAGLRKMREERKADDMVKALPHSRRAQPRILQDEGARIGLNLQFTE